MTGEMCQWMLEPGGEHYEWGQHLFKAGQELCRKTGWKLKGPELRPFDAYQGPYLSFERGGGTLWCTDTEDEFSFEHRGLPDARLTGDVEYMAHAINRLHHASREVKSS